MKKLKSSIIASIFPLILALNTNAKTTELSKLNQLITDNYVLEDNIPSILSTLSSKEFTDKVSMLTASTQVAKHLTSTLQSFDTHFTVQAIPSLAKLPSSSKQIKEPWFNRLARANYGFSAIEVLPGNIGYINFWGFANVTKEAKQRVHNILASISDTHALIIDLRENGGGSSEMVAFMSSYFLPGKVHLNSFYHRPTNSTQTFYTSPKKQLTTLNTLPLFILTSAQTFSAAEEFAYNLKHLQRATIIGEKTKGGANPWQWFELSEDYRVAIPVSKAINPITQTNWEKVGVIPDCEINMDQKEIAHAMALSAIKAPKNLYHSNEVTSTIKKFPDKIIQQMYQCQQTLASTQSAKHLRQ